MKIIVKCCTPEWYDAVTHAVIDFDLALADDLLEKLNYAQLVADRYGTEKRFMGLEFDDYSPEFINLGDPTEIGLEDDSLDAGFAIILAKFQDCEFVDANMRPVMQMVMAGDVAHHPLTGRVKNGRVYWYGYDKHGGAESRTETYSLYEKDIREIREALMSQNTLARLENTT